MGIEIENKKKREKLVLGWIPQLWPNSPFSPAALSAQNPTQRLICIPFAHTTVSLPYGPALSAALFAADVFVTAFWAHLVRLISSTRTTQTPPWIPLGFFT
jgi:hypothetical protein